MHRDTVDTGSLALTDGVAWWHMRDLILPYLTLDTDAGCRIEGDASVYLSFFFFYHDMYLWFPIFIVPYSFESSFIFFLSRFCATVSIFYHLRHSPFFFAFSPSWYP